MSRRMSNNAEQPDKVSELESEEDFLSRMQHRHPFSQREREENTRGETGK